MSTPPADTKYVYTKTYESTGKYVFSITVKDTLGNQKTTEEKTFWITDDLDDTDNDGMPDDWEERYGLNPYDPNDASQDKDNDGITNLEEYQQGTNPLKKLSSSSEISDRLQENWAYLTASLHRLSSHNTACVVWDTETSPMTIITRRTIPFVAIIFFAFLVFVFSLWDILYHEQWLERIIALYAILILLTFLFLVSREKKKPVVQKSCQ